MPLNVEEGLEALPNEPPDPLIMLQEPVPMEGVLADRVTLVSPHVEDPVWSGPASGGVGFMLNLTVTSEDDDVQGLLLMVHLSV